MLLLHSFQFFLGSLLHCAWEVGGVTGSSGKSGSLAFGCLTGDVWRMSDGFDEAFQLFDFLLQLLAKFRCACRRRAHIMWTKVSALKASSLRAMLATNYFTSCDAHHDIYTFSYWQIFWHSIWHIFWHPIWHSIWHIFWHMFWHSIWQIFWHIFWHSIWLTFYLAYLLTFFLAFYLAYLLTFYLTYLLTFFLAYLLTFCLAYLLTFFLTFFLAFYLAYLLTFYLTSFLTFFPLRSGSAHCDLEVAVEVRQCPLRSGSRGWGPAVHTGIWSSRWGPAVPTGIWSSRLRSGSAHCDLEVAVEVRLCPLGSGLRGGGGGWGGGGGRGGGGGGGGGEQLW